MDRILLSNDDIKFIFDWKDKHKDEIHRLMIPLKALKFELTEQNITMTAIKENDKLTLTASRLGKSIGKAKMTLFFDGELSGKAAINSNTIDVTKVAPVEIIMQAYKTLTNEKFDGTAKENKEKLNHLYTMDLLTLYCSVMALLVFGAEEINPDNLVEKARTTAVHKKNQKKKIKKKDSITYILSRKVGKKPSIKAKGSHNSPSESFSVRGHFRHYKNGRVIWIDSYIKGKEKSTHHDKTYKL